MKFSFGVLGDSVCGLVGPKQCNVVDAEALWLLYSLGDGRLVVLGWFL